MSDVFQYVFRGNIFFELDESGQTFRVCWSSGPLLLTEPVVLGQVCTPPHETLTLLSHVVLSLYSFSAIVHFKDQSFFLPLDVAAIFLYDVFSS